MKMCYGAAVAVVVIWIGYAFFINKLGNNNGNGLQLSHLTNIGVYLHLYARTHQSEFPPTLDALVPAQLSKDQLEKLQFFDPKTRKTEPWTYYAGYSQKDAPDLIVAASPEPVPASSDKTHSKKARLVLQINGNTHEMSEADFQETIQYQKKHYQAKK